MSPYDEDYEHDDDYEDEVWNDDDWAGYLGVDREDVDKSFDDQM